MAKEDSATHVQESQRREGPYELPQKDKLKSILKEKVKCERKDGKVAAARAAVVAEPSFSDPIHNQMKEPRWTEEATSGYRARRTISPGPMTAAAEFPPGLLKPYVGVANSYGSFARVAS